MSEIINVYCDESCHLEHDGISVMGLGGVWCPQDKVREINKRIREIKDRNGVPARAEVKWAKVGPAKEQLYIDLINYFFDDDDIHFRALIVPDKTMLDHERFNQTHEEWYYKMYFEMLKVVFDPTKKYHVYLDIMNTHSATRTKKMHDVCCNDMYDFSHSIIETVQPIRSEEVQIMQIVDILLGATVYANRSFPDGFVRSATKTKLIDLIRSRSGYNLMKSTLLLENKFNVFLWRANYGL